MGHRYTISFFQKELKKIIAESKKMENFKKKSMGSLCTRPRLVAGVLFLQCDFFSVVHPKPAPLRRWWIQQSVCLEAAVLPLLAKNSYLWLLKGSV